MYRAFPFAVRVTTFETTLRLIGRFLLFVVAVDFTEFIDAHERRFLAGVGTLHFQKLEYVWHARACSLGREAGFDQLADFTHIRAPL